MTMFNTVLMVALFLMLLMTSGNIQKTSEKGNLPSLCDDLAIEIFIFIFIFIYYLLFNNNIYALHACKPDMHVLSQRCVPTSLPWCRPHSPIANVYVSPFI